MTNRITPPSLALNYRANQRCDRLVQQAVDLRIVVHQVGSARVVDLGVETAGGLEAGRQMAEIALSGLGEVSLTVDPRLAGPAVAIRTDWPVAACMASQYAGWEIGLENYFAMGSGPMRAAYGHEEIFDAIGHRETTDVAVGLLETSQLPDALLCQQLAEQCNVPASGLTLLVAPTNSQAGNVQVVARSVETALHKLHELSFDLSRIESAWGIAPLPPVAGDALTGIGRTNDAILYASHVVLYVRGDEQTLQQIGPQIPSVHRANMGDPFERYLLRAITTFIKSTSFFSALPLWI